jgi:hypothetical protein
MFPTTPRRINSSLSRFMASLESVGKPSFLPFVPVSPDYRNGYCLANCEAESKRTNAEIVFGWVVWELRSQSFMEAEFHAVVRRSNQLADITPRRDEEKLVLFVPDLKRIAVRHDSYTWDTWTNHKKHGAHFEPTRQIYIQDPNPNVLV